MNTKLLFKNSLLLCGLAITSLLGAQTPKSVCQVSQAPVDRDHVATPGSVSSISGDEFYLNDGGCSIKCDLNDGVPVPIMGQIIVVYGYVEVDDDDPVAKATEDETEIDVYSWTSNGGEKPNPPVATVSTVADALASADGTYAELTGSVT